MNRADVWLGDAAPDAQRGNAEVRAMDTARLIAARPFVVVLTRRDPVTKKNVQLPPQTVRLEIIQSIRSSGEQQNSQLEISKQYVVLIGLRDHPTLPNFNVQRADWFMYLGRRIEIVEFVNTIPGRLLASEELTP